MTRKNKKISDILDELVHDLKSPLVRIKAATAILVNNSNSKNKKDTLSYLTTIDQQASLENEFINLLIDIINIKDGKMNLFYELVDINAFIKEIIMNLNNVKAVNNKYVLADKRNILVDKNRMKQALRAFNTILTFSISLDNKPILKTLIEENYFIMILSFSGKSRISYSMISNLELDKVNSKEERKALIQLFIAREIISLHGGKMRINQEDKSTNLLLALPLKRTN